MFYRSICVLEALTKQINGMSRKDLYAACDWFTPHVIDAVLRDLHQDNFIRKVKKGRNVLYAINERAAEYCCYVSRGYAENEGKINE